MPLSLIKVEPCRGGREYGSQAKFDRFLELVRAILRRCVNDWVWLDRAPSVRMLREPTRRIRFLTRDEAQQLLAALPVHRADMAAFSLATGLRASNVTGLQWSQVDLARRLAWTHPVQAKARRAIPVPLNAEAVSLISKQVGKHLTHVFSFRGKPREPREEPIERPRVGESNGRERPRLCENSRYESPNKNRPLRSLCIRRSSPSEG